MSKKNRAKPGTWVERDLFTSRAYINLKGGAPQVLMQLLGKRDFGHKADRKGTKSYQCLNCDNLTMPYKALEALGFTRPRITRAIDELLEKGFLTIVRPGGAYRQDRAVYGLSDKWKQWTPGHVFETRGRDVKRGFQDHAN